MTKGPPSRRQPLSFFALASCTRQRVYTLSPEWRTRDYATEYTPCPTDMQDEIIKPPATSLFQQLRRVCSLERLDAYRITGENEIDALTSYLWNTALCEALYPSLQNLEIGVRNRLNDALVKSYDDPEWYDDHGIIIDAECQRKVAEAKQTLLDENKAVTPARVVAELSFGFWTRLFRPQFHEVIWERRDFLKDAFPFMPRQSRKRNVLAGRFGNIRKLRNRVFHHEPILRRVNLGGEHADILQALGWLDPCLQTVTKALDRFPQVYTTGYKDDLRKKLVNACPVESKLVVLARKAAMHGAAENAREN